MKKLILSILIVLIISPVLYCELGDDDLPDFIPYKKGDKWGIGKEYRNISKLSYGFAEYYDYNQFSCFISIGFSGGNGFSYSLGLRAAFLAFEIGGTSHSSEYEDSLRGYRGGDLIIYLQSHSDSKISLGLGIGVYNLKQKLYNETDTYSYIFFSIRLEIITYNDQTILGLGYHGCRGTFFYIGRIFFSDSF